MPYVPRRAIFRLSSFVFCLSAASIAFAESAPKLALEQAAPEITATTLDGQPVSIATLNATNQDKILVLQFASITDPVFRSHVPAVEKLAARNAANAVFVIVYQKEAHAADGVEPLDLNAPEGFNIAEPTSLGERQKLAQQMIDRLKVKNETVVVDAWSNASSNRYGGYPNMTFIIDAKGLLQAGYPFMDTAKVQAAIDLLASGQPLTPELKGPTQKSGPAPFDFANAAADMTGGRGPATIATILERASLSEQQKLTLLPALADFLADVQTFRQTRQAVPNLPARGPARGQGRGAPSAGRAAAPPPPPAPAGSATEPKTIEDLQAAQAALRASASRVQSIIHQTMPTKDATAMLDALDAMVPAQNVFAKQ